LATVKNASVMTHTVGIPTFSKLTESWRLQAVQLPHSPTPVTTASAWVMRGLSTSSLAGRVKNGF
jgi:hypothetical protein